MRLDQNAISTLVDLADPIGVLSLYVGVPAERPSKPQEIKRMLMGLEKDLEGALARDEWARLHHRLVELEPEVEKLIDPRATGRGRALFAPISEPRIETVSLQLELPTRVEFQKSAVVEPLVAALDEGRPAGMVTIHRHGVHIFEWRLDETEELAARKFDVENDEWRHMHGPARQQPMRGMETVTHEDRYSRRVEANRYRFLEAIGREIAELISQRGWERLVIFGDPRLSEAVTTTFPEELKGCDIFFDHRLIDGNSKESLHQHVTPILRQAQKKREAELVSRIRDAALARGRGCLGLKATLDALNQSRVEHLITDAKACFCGLRTAGGMLFVAGDPAATATGEEVLDEPNLIEQMVKRTLGMNGQVTPIESEVAAELAPYEGVAALLRW